jgi:RNA polymerase sigma-70 factor (ECF subfamily)
MRTARRLDTPRPATRPAPADAAPADDAAWVARLRAGDEAAFVALVSRHHRALLQLALAYAGTRAAAEEVVQDTWVAVLDGLANFEERSSLRTWIARILVNRAKTRAVRDGRTVPFSSLDLTDAEDGCAFDARGFWSAPPTPWDHAPEALLLRKESREMLERELALLPAAQRAVVTLRDVDGWTSEEVCNVLDLSETNQRVLLHRGRSRMRAALERHKART